MGNKTFISHTVNIINRSHKGQSRKNSIKGRNNSFLIVCPWRN